MALGIVILHEVQRQRFDIDKNAHFVGEALATTGFGIFVTMLILPFFWSESQLRSFEARKFLLDCMCVCFSFICIPSSNLMCFSGCCRRSIVELNTLAIMMNHEQEKHGGRL